MRKDWLWSVMLLCLPLVLLGLSRPVFQPGERQAVSGLKDGFARYLPKGTYLRGQHSGGHEDERPVHQVTLTRSVWMLETEVTQAQMKSLMGYNPSCMPFCKDSSPVESVSWHEAAAFANALSQKQGIEVCFTCEGNESSVACEPKSHKGYVTCKGWRLPTEAEWEYAARAGTTGERYGELDAVAWHSGNSGPGTQPVGRKQANAWGLHDMLGNVWEWCYDWQGAYSAGTQVDPVGPSSGSDRMFRGGSWYNSASYIRAAYRYNYPPDGRDNHIGFRLLKWAE